jgi:hypothetical protein
LHFTAAYCTAVYETILCCIVMFKPKQPKHEILYTENRLKKQGKNDKMDENEEDMDKNNMTNQIIIKSCFI